MEHHLSYSTYLLTMFNLSNLVCTTCGSTGDNHDEDLEAFIRVVPTGIIVKIDVLGVSDGIGNSVVRDADTYQLLPKAPESNRPLSCTYRQC